MAEYKFQTYAAYKSDGEMKIGVVPDDAPLTLNGVPLYPRREWVGLTDEEVEQGLLRSDYALQTAHAWRAGVVFAMTKLKEKNNA